MVAWVRVRICVQMDMTAAALSRQSGLSRQQWLCAALPSGQGRLSSLLSRVWLSEPSSLAGRRVPNFATVRGRPTLSLLRIVFRLCWSLCQCPAVPNDIFYVLPVAVTGNLAWFRT